MSFGQDGPGQGPGGSTPDWAALADETERERNRKRRWMIAGAGALATVVVAGIVAFAVVNEGGGGGRASDKPSETLPTPEDLPSNTGADPTFKDEPPPPPPPRDFVSNAKRDKAPLNVGTLYPSKTVSINGRPYKRTSTDTSKGCTDAAHAGLGPVLSKNDCESLFRATYTRAGLAVTVGIAVFEDAGTAAKVKSQYQPNLVALKGGGVPDFCRTVTCRTTANSFGRYAYFTIAGRTNGEPSTAADKKAEQAGRDGSTYAYARILKRGKDQAAAAVGASPEE
jgi:hypothetical protein